MTTHVAGRMPYPRARGRSLSGHPRAGMPDGRAVPCTGSGQGPARTREGPGTIGSSSWRSSSRAPWRAASRPSTSWSPWPWPEPSSRRPPSSSFHDLLGLRRRRGRGRDVRVVVARAPETGRGAVHHAEAGAGQFLLGHGLLQPDAVGPRGARRVEGALGAGAIASAPLQGGEVQRRPAALVSGRPVRVGEDPLQRRVGLLGAGLSRQRELGDAVGGAGVVGRRLERRQVGLPRAFRLSGAPQGVSLERQGGGKPGVRGCRLGGELGRAGGVAGEERHPALDHPAHGAGVRACGRRGGGAGLPPPHGEGCARQARGGRDVGGALRRVEEALGGDRGRLVPVVGGQHRKSLGAQRARLHGVDGDERLEDLGCGAVPGPCVGAHQLAGARHPLIEHLSPVMGAVEQRRGEHDDRHAGEGHELDHP